MILRQNKKTYKKNVWTNMNKQWTTVFLLINIYKD